MKTAKQWAEEINKACDAQGGFDSVDDIENWIEKITAERDQTILQLEATVAVMRTISLTDISDLVIENQNQLICSQAHRTDEAEMHLFRFQKLFKKIGNALSQSAPPEMLAHIRADIERGLHSLQHGEEYENPEAYCCDQLEDALRLLPKRQPLRRN